MDCFAANFHVYRLCDPANHDVVLLRAAWCWYLTTSASSGRCALSCGCAATRLSSASREASMLTGNSSRQRYKRKLNHAIIYDYASNTNEFLFNN